METKQPFTGTVFQRISLADSVRPRLHGSVYLGFVRALYILLRVANKNAVDNPHIKMPVKPSTGPNSRHSFGNTGFNMMPSAAA